MTMFCGSESRLTDRIYLPNHAHQNVISARNKHIQWNPSIAATLGEQHFGRYIGVAFIEGLFLCTNCSFGTWVPGRYIAVGLYSGVAVKRGSTVNENLVWGSQYCMASIRNSEWPHFRASLAVLQRA